MMPKGVEHIAIAKVEIRERCVRIPMMPKGVEHISDVECLGHSLAT